MVDVCQYGMGLYHHSGGTLTNLNRTDLPVHVLMMLPSAASASETLPSSAFESLLPKLLTILQVTQRPEGTSNVRNKQDLLQAVSGTSSP